MNQNEALEKARRFAQTAYTAEVENLSREYQTKIAAMRSQMAARGRVLSGSMISETARINAERITAMVKLRLNTLLDGCEAHGVYIDDQLAETLSAEVFRDRENWVAMASRSRQFPQGLPLSAKAMYPQLVGQNVSVNAAWIKTQIDRRRFMAKKKDAPTTAYYVQGENARVNVNSTDHSVNIVMKSTEEFFGTIRQRIESGIPEGEEQRKVLDALTTLQESHGKPSFAQRYTEFIAIAADYVTLLTPFIPQLTQMLHKVLP